MRVWYLDYGFLDPRRLASQHYEAHGLITVCLNPEKRWGAISEEFRKSVPALIEAHNKAAAEMCLRKGTPLSEHKTWPISIQDIPDENKSIVLKITHEMVAQDVLSLRSKFEREGYFNGMGRLDLSEVEKEFNLPLGLDAEQAAEKRKATKAIILENKEFFTAKKMKKHVLGKRMDLFAAQFDKDPFDRDSRFVDDSI